MILIVEGPDGSGKTTLAEYLSKNMNIPIRHRNKPTTDEEKEQMFQMYKDDTLTDDNIIWDRCFYSEIVYGPIMRDKSYINYDAMMELERLIALKGGLIIYCTDNTNTLWERCQQRGELYITSLDIMTDIKEAYDDLMLKGKHLIPIVTHRVP